MPRDGPDVTFEAAFQRLVRAALAADDMPGDEVNLIDAGLDSFGLVRLMMDLEDEFGGFWPVEQLSDFADLAIVGTLRIVAWDALQHRPA